MTTKRKTVAPIRKDQPKLSVMKLKTWLVYSPNLTGAATPNKRNTRQMAKEIQKVIFVELIFVLSNTVSPYLYYSQTKGDG